MRDSSKKNILIMTPVGRTSDGKQIDYFPSRWSGSSGDYKVTSFYPFHLCYLSSYLKANTDHDVRFIDANYNGVDSAEYLEILAKIQPDILVVEIDAIIFEKQQEIFRCHKIAFPEVKIIACGPSPTATPELALEHGADFVAIGEFEEPIYQFIKNGLDPKTPGIYPNGRGPLVDINKLPFPENDDVKRRDYCRLYGSEYREVEMWATRGCPAMCNFCVITNVYYNKPVYRTRNLDNLVAEIRSLQRDIPDLEGIFFNEEAHTINKTFLTALCNRLIEEGLNEELHFNCMGNYDTLTPELLALMKKAGYYKVRVGIETLDTDNMNLLSSTKLKSGIQKFLSTLEACREVGIKVYGTLSVGTFGSTFAKDIATIDQIWGLYQEDLIQEFSLSINTPMQGTPFYDMCVKNGWLNDSFDSYDGSKGAMISFPDYTTEDINRAFAYGTGVRERINRLNQEKGVNYSSYDKDWCAPVYATSSRVIGQGIL